MHGKPAAPELEVLLAGTSSPASDRTEDSTAAETRGIEENKEAEELIARSTRENGPRGQLLTSRPVPRQVPEAGKHTGG